MWKKGKRGILRVGSWGDRASQRLSESREMAAIPFLMAFFIVITGISKKYHATRYFLLDTVRNSVYIINQDRHGKAEVKAAN